MKVILKKQPPGSSSGWKCEICREGIRGWKDAEIHAANHGIPRDFIATHCETGDVLDTRYVDLDALRTAGMI